MFRTLDLRSKGREFDSLGYILPEYPRDLVLSVDTFNRYLKHLLISLCSLLISTLQRIRNFSGAVLSKLIVDYYHYRLILLY